MALDSGRLLRVAATSPVLSRNIVQLACLDGVGVRYVDEHLGREPFASTARPGHVRPAGSTAMGIAALSGLDPDAASAVIAALPAADVEHATLAVPEARQRGYAIDPGRVHPSVFGVAVPVTGHPGFALGVPLVEVLPHAWRVEARRYQEVVAALRAAVSVVTTAPV